MPFADVQWFIEDRRTERYLQQQTDEHGNGQDMVIDFTLYGES